MGALSNIIRSVLEFFYNLTGNYGLAIILLTLLVRVILYPLFKKQMTFSAKMREMNPLLKEIQAKYKDKPEEYQKKTMELYQQHKMSPLSGCLPSLVQLPVMISLYQVLMNYLGEVSASFLWISDLSKPDYVLPILVGLSTFGQARTMAVEQDANAKTMTWLMPIFMVYMSFRFAAGLALYWTIFNFTSMMQQYFFNKSWERKAKSAQGEVAKSEKGGKNRENR